MVRTKPADAGYYCVSRERGWQIAVRREWGRFIADPQLIYDKLTEELRKYQLEIDGIFIVDSQEAMQAEIKAMTTKFRMKAGMMPETFRDCLTEWEADNEEGYRAILDDRGVPQARRSFRTHIATHGSICFAYIYIKMLEFGLVWVCFASICSTPSGQFPADLRSWPEPQGQVRLQLRQLEGPAAHIP